MGELIDKAAVVAEIEKRRSRNARNKLNLAASFEDNYLLSFLDTLEVKEVDFEKEINEWMKYGPHTSYPWCTIPDAIKITAEHFFELGLKAKVK